MYFNKQNCKASNRIRVPFNYGSINLLQNLVAINESLNKTI